MEQKLYPFPLHSQPKESKHILALTIQDIAQKKLRRNTQTPFNLNELDEKPFVRP